MKVIGLTGSIATGKSTVSKFLIDQGFEVVDCDQIVHQLLKSHQECINQIKKEFDVVKNNTVDKKALAQLIFNDHQKKIKLEKIIHPLVIKTMQDAIKKSVNKIIFLDIPLLYENKLEYLCDEIIVVYTTPSKQIERLMRREKIDLDYAKKKIHSQISIEEKQLKTKYVINNIKDLQYLYQEIHRVLGALQ